MRSKAIKGVLFSILALTATQARAQVEDKNDDLVLIEELPVETRVVVHARLLEFLKKNPGVLNQDSIFAVDKKGTIYVLDKNLARVGSSGAPSCITQRSEK